MASICLGLNVLNRLTFILRFYSLPPSLHGHGGPSEWTGAVEIAPPWPTHMQSVYLNAGFENKPSVICYHIPLSLGDLDTILKCNIHTCFTDSQRAHTCTKNVPKTRFQDAQNVNSEDTRKT